MGPLTTVSSKFKFNTFKQQTIGAANAQITQPVGGDDVGTRRLHNIFVQALSTNTGKITIKNKNDVTAGGAGIELAAGANYNLPSNNSAEWYIIGSAASQVLNILYSNEVV
jgi:hypothetical protein